MVLRQSDEKFRVLLSGATDRPCPRRRPDAADAHATPGNGNGDGSNSDGGDGDGEIQAVSNDGPGTAGSQPEAQTALPGKGRQPKGTGAARGQPVKAKK